MTSILTNIGAMNALQTLRTLSSKMEDTQRQVSTGLRVGQASDNAAYWSISTTMRSDNMALSAVEDALGLGAAKVDTAYAGMTATVDVLKEVKSRLVAAFEDGVDRDKVQEEIAQLREQIEGISEAASFSGENWLKSDNETSSVVSSFVRADNGSVAVKRVDVDLSAIALYNSTQSGLLDAGVPVDLADLEGLDEQGTGGGWVIRLPFTSPLVFDDDTTAITFNLTVDDDDPLYIPVPQPGVTTAITINRTLVDSVLGTAGIVSTETEWIQVLDAALGAGGASASDWPFSNEFSISTDHTSGARGSHVALSNVQSTLVSGLTGGLVDVSANYGDPARASFRFVEPFTLGKVEVALRLTADGNPYDVTINQDTLDRALQRSDATVENIDDYALVLSLAFSNANTGYSAEVTTGWSDNIPRVTIRGNPAVHKAAGSNSTVELEFQYADWGMGLADIDVTGSASLDAMLRAVERMLSSTTSAAATLGALQSRIDMQSDFVSKLTDSIDSGIGRLVDANMNEASTRLKALQTQEQLAIQSLSIANTSAESILTLFR